MNYKELSRTEKKQILDLAELAYGGNKDALEQLRTITGAEIRTAADIYKITMAITRASTNVERADDYGRIKQRMTTPLPIPPKITPQDRWQQKVGLISKSYKLKQTIVDDFAEACEKQGESQAATLTTLMQDWIDKSK